ncbi:Hypothetical predicted protein [Marmota monax]|uniref:Uncharacterized protein n=1 Tax=Marmota monax TaxID=9995 RepID=A0A5E4AMF5_MARMO|nr:Hypothetical predicted protein [Marmota monax]
MIPGKKSKGLSTCPWPNPGGQPSRVPASGARLPKRAASSEHSGYRPAPPRPYARRARSRTGRAGGAWARGGRDWERARRRFPEAPCGRESQRPAAAGYFTDIINF